MKREFVEFCGTCPTYIISQDYKMLVRDLATTLLFLVVFLKSHSEELREAEGREKGGGLDKCWTKHLLVREDVSRDVNALFVALADIFHCWFSSPVSTYVCTP